MFTWHISFDVRRILSSHADLLFPFEGAVLGPGGPERENDKRASGRGDGRARTGDPLLAKQVLSQLSYIPEWAFLDSNQRPHGYQPCALTN